MGNRGGAVFKRDNRKYKLDISNLDYGTVIANLKKEYEISSDCCIVLEKKTQNRDVFISTSHIWDEFKKIKRSKINVLDQIKYGIKACQFKFYITRCIFKILNNYKEIVGLGVKISESLCLCPKNIRLHENFKEFCRCFTIELFDGRSGFFLENGFDEVLGENGKEKYFFICQISLNCEVLGMKLYDGRKIVKGNCIYFSKETQMLEVITHCETLTNKRNYYTLNNQEDCKTWLPGSIMFGKEKRANESEDENVIGIYYGGAGYLWYSMNTIIYQICERYITSVDENFKKAVLGMKALRFNLESLAPILNEGIQIYEKTVKPKNKFREIYN